MTTSLTFEMLTSDLVSLFITKARLIFTYTDHLHQYPLASFSNLLLNVHHNKTVKQYCQPQLATKVSIK